MPGSASDPSTVLTAGVAPGAAGGLPTAGGPPEDMLEEGLLRPDLTDPNAYYADLDNRRGRGLPGSGPKAPPTSASGRAPRSPRR